MTAFLNGNLKKRFICRFLRVSRFLIRKIKFINLIRPYMGLINKSFRVWYERVNEAFKNLGYERSKFRSIVFI